LTPSQLVTCISESVIEPMAHRKWVLNVIPVASLPLGNQSVKSFPVVNITTEQIERGGGGGAP
jgi:hypothetical protein